MSAVADGPSAAAAAAAPPERPRLVPPQRGSWLIVAPYAIVLAFPFYWMVITTFKKTTELYQPRPGAVLVA